MENTLNAIHAAKKCFESYSLDQLKSMDKQSLKLLCVKERADLVNYLDQLNTKSLIRERLEIKNLNKKESIQRRREFLDNYFK
jgi:hypothetical protein